MFDLSKKTTTEFIEASYEVYGSYSYSTGYMQSVLENCLEKMKKKDALRVINQLEDATKSLRAMEQLPQLENK